MKIIFFALLFCKTLIAQGYENMFDPNSDYLDRGEYQITFTNNLDADIDKSYANYRPISWRTVAVDPLKILPGSIIFIPQLVGTKLNDGTFHDGYFLAHRVLKKYPALDIKLFIGDLSRIPANKNLMKVYKVQGVMAKSLRTRFELQYRSEKELPTFKMVASDFDQLMKTGNRQFQNITERIQYYSERGIGTPYLIFNLGEGPDSYVDPDPTIDFARTDCMTFCEHTLALAISSSYSEMYTNLQKIRYKEGIKGYTNRNHYTIVDWLPNNAWLLEDVTNKIGGKFTKEMTKSIDRPAFYKTNGVSEQELNGAPPKTEMQVSYIPKENVMLISENFQGGEIVSVVSNHPDVFSAHMGIIVIDRWGNIIFRHASSTLKTNEVLDIRLSDYIETMIKSKSRLGMIFMRPRQEFKIPY